MIQAFPLRLKSALVLASLAVVFSACKGINPEATPPSTPQAAGQTALPSAPPPAQTMVRYSLTARSLGYKLQLLELRAEGDTLYTLARLSAPTGMAGMALEELELEAQVPFVPAKTIHFIIGSPSGIFEPPANITFVEDSSQLPPAFNAAKRL